MEKFNFHTLDQAIKCNFKKKIILTTSDQEIIQKSRKKGIGLKLKYIKERKNYPLKMCGHETICSSEAISKFYERIPDILVILAFQNPFKREFLYRKSRILYSLIQ